MQKQNEEQVRTGVLFDGTSKVTFSPSSFCYVAPDVPIPSPRGSSVHVREVAKSLVSRGKKIHIICRRTTEDDPRNEDVGGSILHRIYRFIISPGGRVVRSPGRTASEKRKGPAALLYGIYLRTLFSLYVSLVITRIVQKNKIDAIIERETSFGAGGLASILTRKPMILEITGPQYSRISVWRSKKILYYTDSMLRKWVDRRKCVEVSGGVNLAVFHEDAETRKEIRQQLGFSVDNRVIGYVGTFQDWHGIDTVLYALKELRPIFGGTRALFVGPYFEKYQELARNLGLDDICIFTGAVEYEKVPGYINASDIMVALYEPERNELRRRYGIGSPLKILECMACGKPVISTRVKPIDKVVTNGHSGYLVTPGDRKELVVAISTLLNDKSIYNLIAANGRQVAETHFSWESIVDIIENTLRSQ